MIHNRITPRQTVVYIHSMKATTRSNKAKAEIKFTFGSIGRFGGMSVNPGSSQTRCAPLTTD